MRDYATISKRLRRYSENCVAYKLDADFANAVTDAADAIEELLAELTTIRKQLPHWISVEERLPEKSKIVLVAYDNGVVAQGMLFFGKFRGANFGFDENDEPIIAEVTHWMPLPAPPKGGGVMADIIETNIFDREEIYPNCTVQVLTNSVTGEVSVGWWPNDNKPIETKEGN